MKALLTNWQDCHILNVFIFLIFDKDALHDKGVFVLPYNDSPLDKRGCEIPTRQRHSHPIPPSA